MIRIISVLSLLMLGGLLGSACQQEKAVDIRQEPKEASRQPLKQVAPQEKTNPPVGNTAEQPAAPVTDITIKPGKSLGALPDFKPAGLNAPEVAAFLDTLKVVVLKGEKEKLAALIDYPCNVSRGGKSFKLLSPEDFLARYNELMNDKVITAIRNQEISELMVNWRGVKIGRGEIWFSGIDLEEAARTASGKEYQLKIIAINHF